MSAFATPRVNAGALYAGCATTSPSTVRSTSNVDSPSMSPKLFPDAVLPVNVCPLESVSNSKPYSLLLFAILFVITLFCERESKEKPE